MKTQQYFLLTTLLLLPIQNELAQQKGDVQITPNAKFDVHRQYDENGNLIEYDSSSVTTWSYNGSDSLSDFWSYTPSQTDSNGFLSEESHHFYYNFPGDEFPDFPQFDFGLTFHELDSLMQGFNFDFSVSPGDSVYSDKNPYLNFHSEFPPINSEIELYLRDIQRFFEDMISGQENYFQEFDQDEIEQGIPEVSNPDSSMYTPSPAPALRPTPQNYSDPVLNI
jgi:hypothetical protein